MTFLNPLFLAGAGLIALPIVLHLIMRQKPKLFEFPALRFVQTRHDANRRRLQLRHLLLLLLRVAAIALLALALARPSVHFGQGLGSQEAPVAAALVFDAAPRMEYKHENQTRLEAAKQLGTWLLAQLPAESQIAIVDTRLGSPVFQVDRGAAKQRLERLETVANSQPLVKVLDETLLLLKKSELARKEIYVFTDLSRGAWGDAAGGTSLRDRVTDVPGVGIYLIDVGVTEPADFALGELRLSGQVLSKGSPLTVRTELARLGPKEKRTVELYLQDPQQKPQKRSEAAFDVGAGQSQKVEFRVGGLELGAHQGFVRIVGQDGLAADDTRYFSIDVRPAWRVLVAAPPPAEPHALFLTEALAPTVFRKRGQSRFDCEIVSLDKLPKQKLADYAAVCLLDPTPLEPAAWKQLADYAAEGHGVAIFLGRNAAKVDSFNAPQAQEILPSKLLLQARRPDGDCHLAPRDYQHPVLAAFRDQAGSIPWDAFPVFRYWELDKPSPGVGIVLPYTDGRPAVLERPVGRGRVLTMTTPVSDLPSREPWNLLPVGEAWPFMVLSNEMLLYLVGGSQEHLNYAAGEMAVLPLDAQSQRRTYQLTAPGDLKLPLAADLQRHLLTISATDQAGNYRVQAGGRESGVDRGFSVNLGLEQTRLDRVTEDELKKTLGPFPYRIARTRQQIDRSVSLARVGRELFPSLILLLAVVLGLEHFVANRFYRE